MQKYDIFFLFLHVVRTIAINVKQNKTIMKKIFLFIVAAFMSAGVASAQDLNEAITLAKDGNAAFELGEYNLAIEAFTKSLTIAESIEGEEAANHAGTCKTAICAIYLSNAKALLKAGDYNGALAKLNETIAAAESYNAAETVASATELIPSVYMAQGNAALKAKDMAGAIAAYTKVTELNPANGDAYLRLGRALAASGKVEEAVAAYETAAANGEEKDAKKQLSTLFLKKAQASLKGGKGQEAIDFAMKSNEYLESANAYNIAAKAAQKLGKNADCIAFYQKYLELKPNAKDAAGVKFTIAALYQQMGDKAKAVEYYTMVASDPQFGAGAQEQLKVLK